MSLCVFHYTPLQETRYTKVPEKPQINEDVNKIKIPAPDYVATPSNKDIPANAEGNPNNRFGYAANKDKQPAVSSKVETPVKPEEKFNLRLKLL